MPIPPIGEIVAYNAANILLRLRTDQRTEFRMHFYGGKLDDPFSFDAAGGTAGELGYYPMIFADETTRYLPCAERMVVNIMAAIASSPNLRALMRGKRLTEVIDAGPLPAGASIVLPIVWGAPQQALTQSFARTIEHDAGDKYRLIAVDRADRIDLILSWED